MLKEFQISNFENYRKKISNFYAHTSAMNHLENVHESTKINELHTSEGNKLLFLIDIILVKI